MRLMGYWRIRFRLRPVDLAKGGLQPGRDPDSIDAPQAALNRMREAAAARGEIRRKALPSAGAAKAKRGIRDTRGFSQFHSTGRDPLGLGKVVGRLVAERGWSLDLALAVCETGSSRSAGDSVVTP